MVQAIRRAIFKSKKLEGFTHKFEGFTQSKLLLDIKMIRRKESDPFLFSNSISVLKVAKI